MPGGRIHAYCFTWNSSRAVKWAHMTTAMCAAIRTQTYGSSNADAGTIVGSALNASVVSAQVDCECMAGFSKTGPLTGVSCRHLFEKALQMLYLRSLEVVFNGSWSKSCTHTIEKSIEKTPLDALFDRCVKFEILSGTVSTIDVASYSHEASPRIQIYHFNHDKITKG